jgi:hypothetical protein
MPGNPWKNLIVLMSKPTFSGLHGIVESFDTTHGILSKSVHELLYGEPLIWEPALGKGK